MSNAADISVIIPVYNERHGIRRVIDEVLAAGLGERLREVIVVDDGSTDDSAAEVAGLPGVRVVRHESNQGLSAAIATGFREAAGEFVVKMDGDGQHPASELAALPGLLADHDVIWWMRRSQAGTSWARWLARLGLGHLATVLTGHRLPDVLSGFYCCRRELVQSLVACHPAARTFDCWLLLLVHDEPCRVRLVEYDSRRRLDDTGSRMPPLSEGLRLTREIAVHGWRRHRARLAVLVLLAAAVAAGICWGLA